MPSICDTTGIHHHRCPQRKIEGEFYPPSHLIGAEFKSGYGYRFCPWRGPVRGFASRFILAHKVVHWIRQCRNYHPILISRRSTRCVTPLLPLSTIIFQFFLNIPEMWKENPHLLSFFLHKQKKTAKPTQMKIHSHVNGFLFSGCQNRLLISRRKSGFIARNASSTFHLHLWWISLKLLFKRICHKIYNVEDYKKWWTANQKSSDLPSNATLSK